MLPKRFLLLLVNTILFLATAFVCFHGFVFVRSWCVSPPSRTADLPTTTTRITILSNVLKLYDVAVWDQLDTWCEAFSDSVVDVYILYRQRHVEGATYTPHCQLHLIVEPDNLPENRIERLGILRNFLRDSVETTNTDAVVVVDLDVKSLPTPGELAYGIQTNQNTKGIVCANGYEVLAGMKQPYDLFALVEQSGRFRYAELAFRWYATAQQPRMYQYIVQQEYYPVQSCFNGLAIYEPELFFDRRCNYTTSTASISRNINTYRDNDGQICEHVVFHLCLQKYHPEYAAAILPDLPLQRTCELDCLLLGLFYWLAVYGGSCIVCMGVWRWRQHMLRYEHLPTRKLF